MTEAEKPKTGRKCGPKAATATATATAIGIRIRAQRVPQCPVDNYYGFRYFVPFFFCIFVFTHILCGLLWVLGSEVTQVSHTSESPKQQTAAKRDTVVAII